MVSWWFCKWKKNNKFPKLLKWWMGKRLENIRKHKKKHVQKVYNTQQQKHVEVVVCPSPRVKRDNMFISHFNEFKVLSSYKASILHDRTSTTITTTDARQWRYGYPSEWFWCCHPYGKKTPVLRKLLQHLLRLYSETIGSEHMKKWFT